MKNKILLLLPLLLITAAAQCMEQAIISKPKTIQDIRTDRDEIYKKRFNDAATVKGPLDYILFQSNWSLCLEQLKQVTTFNYIELKDCLRFREKEYSFLGLVTIAIKSEHMPDEHFMMKGIHNKNLLNKKNPEQPSFNEKKEHIRELLLLGFKPTAKDKYFALLATYEEHGPSIINKKLLLQNLPLLSEIEIPQEIMQYITQLMWETEESLL
jgi:hypothetical protein